jgi:hypothetical protein
MWSTVGGYLAVLFFCLLVRWFVKSCFRVGLSALPLCGAAPTFFAAAKKVTPAPGRGSANRPTRIQDFTKAKAKAKTQSNKLTRLDQ